MAKKENTAAPPKDYGPARVGEQDYQWRRQTLLATAPWDCLELPGLDGDGHWRAGKVTPAAMRDAVSELVADGGFRRDLQVVEQRAHLVESGEDDAIVPWHHRELDCRVHRAAFWLLHVGARLAERRAAGADKALRAGGRALRLLLADRRTRTAVDRSELLVGALALAAAGSVAEAAEAVAGLRGATPVDNALVALLTGDAAAARRAAQGVSVRATRGSLHARLADAIGPLLDAVSGGKSTELDQAGQELGAVRELAAADQDSWTWWRARLVRVIAKALPRRVPAVALAEPLGEHAARIARGIERLAGPGLRYLDDAMSAAVLQAASSPCAVVAVDDYQARGQVIAAAVMAAPEDPVVAVVTGNRAQARAIVQQLERLGTSLGRSGPCSADDTSARWQPTLVGTAAAVATAMQRPDAEGRKLGLLVIADLPDGTDDLTVENAVASEGLATRADTEGARRLLLCHDERRGEALAGWWHRKARKSAKKAASVVAVEVAPPKRRGVLFITDGRARIAWRDPIGTLQPDWIERLELEDRQFPIGRSEWAAAAAVRFARLGPTVLVCAAPRAMSEAVRGAMQAAELRDNVVRPHGWPHEPLQRLERAAREQGLDEARATATRDGFASWSCTDAAPLRDATEALLAGTAARVAIVDLDYEPERLAGHACVVLTGPSADAQRLDAAKIARFARRCGVPGVDRQGLVLIAVDGRRAREQVVRDLEEADALLAAIDRAEPVEPLEFAAGIIAQDPKSEEAKHLAQVIKGAPGAAWIESAAKTLAAVSTTGKERKKVVAALETALNG